jgi:hypothetical protein
VDIYNDKIDEAVLTLLHLTLHDRFRAWKGHDRGKRRAVTAAVGDWRGNAVVR